MYDARPLISDYKANVPLCMLENKYRIPIHRIIVILHAVITKQKGSK